MEFFTLAAPTLLRAAATSSLYMRPRAFSEGPRPIDEPTPLQGAWRIPPKVFLPKNGEATDHKLSIKKFSEPGLLAAGDHVDGGEAVPEEAVVCRRKGE